MKVLRNLTFHLSVTKKVVRWTLGQNPKNKGIQASKTRTSWNILLGLQIKGLLPLFSAKKSFRIQGLIAVSPQLVWALLYQFALWMLPSEQSCIAVGASGCRHGTDGSVAIMDLKSETLDFMSVSDLGQAPWVVSGVVLHSLITSTRDKQSKTSQNSSWGSLKILFAFGVCFPGHL